MKEEEAHVRVVCVVRGSCFLSRLFVVIFTAKDFMACFSLFVPFASFAVQDSKTECPLYFKPRNTRKSRTKNGVSVVAPKRFEEESKEKVSPSSLERGPRAVKEEEALVRAVRVVRGS